MLELLIARPYPAQGCRSAACCAQAQIPGLSFVWAWLLAYAARLVHFTERKTEKAGNGVRKTPSCFFQLLETKEVTRESDAAKRLKKRPKPFKTFAFLAKTLQKPAVSLRFFSKLCDFLHRPLF